MQLYSSELIGSGREASPVDAELRTYVRAFLTPLVPGVLIGLALAVSAFAGLAA